QVHRRGQVHAVDDLLGMLPIRFEKEPVEEEELSALTGRAVALADQMADRMGRGRTLGIALDRAQISLRPGEFLIILGAAALGIAVVLFAAFHSLPIAALSVGVTAFVASRV